MSFKHAVTSSPHPPTPDKALKDTLDQVLLSGYFDRIPSHQNGVCEEEEDEEPASAAVPAPAESSEAEEQTVDPGPDQRFFPGVIPTRLLIKKKWNGIKL